ncbi:MAG: phage late control D family protein [Oscillochloris sp.]|nr:phage late control D family protein [Oscillochloris sp.]
MSVVSSTILSGGKAMPPQYELLSIDVIRDLNRIPSAQVVLLDGSPAEQKFEISNSEFFKPGQTIEIRLRYEGESDQEATVFKGLVVAQRVEANNRGSQLSVTLKDAAFAMTLVRSSAVYRDKTDDAIIKSLLDKFGLNQGRIGATQLAHQQQVQYACTDWDFMLARAEANGLLVVVEDGSVSLPQLAVTGAATHEFQFGIDPIFDFEIESDGSSQYSDVQSVAWDIQTQKRTSPVKAKKFTLAQGNLKGNELPDALKTDPPILTHPVPLEQKELQAWADGIMARHRFALLRGRIGIPGRSKLKLMDVIAISGIGDRFNGKTVITGIRHRVDQHGWQTDIQFGLAAAGFAERRDLSEVPAPGCCRR